MIFGPCDPENQSDGSRRGRRRRLLPMGSSLGRRRRLSPGAAWRGSREEEKTVSVATPLIWVLTSPSAMGGWVWQPCAWCTARGGMESAFGTKKGAPPESGALAILRSDDPENQKCWQSTREEETSSADGLEPREEEKAVTRLPPGEGLGRRRRPSPLRHPQYADPHPCQQPPVGYGSHALNATVGSEPSDVPRKKGFASKKKRSPRRSKDKSLQGGNNEQAQGGEERLSSMRAR